MEDPTQDSISCRFYSTIQNLTKKERPKSIRAHRAFHLEQENKELRSKLKDQTFRYEILEQQFK
jgi:hypothetical protein